MHGIAAWENRDVSFTSELETSLPEVLSFRPARPSDGRIL